MRFIIVVTALLSLLLISAAVIECVEVTGSEKKKPSDKKKKKAAAPPAKPKKYVELVDLLLDLSKGYCKRLGPLVERRGKYSWRRRCDVMYEAVELFITGFSDTMINELDLTQQDMVNNAQNNAMRMLELKNALKAVAKRALEAERTDEKKLQLLLNTKLSQWVMNTATNKDSNGMGSFGGGGAMGGGGGMSIDDMFGGADPNKLTKSDIQWAEEVSSDDYIDDPAKDDPDEMRKAERGGGRGRPAGGDIPNIPNMKEEAPRSGSEKETVEGGDL